MFIDCLADWYKMAQTIYLQTEILENDLKDQEELLVKLRGKLFILKEDLKTHSQTDPDEQDPGHETKTSTKTTTTPKSGPTVTGESDFPAFSRRDLKALFNLSCDTTTLARENEDLFTQLMSIINSKGLI